VTVADHRVIFDRYGQALPPQNRDRIGSNLYSKPRRSYEGAHHSPNDHLINAAHIFSQKFIHSARKRRRRCGVARIDSLPWSNCCRSSSRNRHPFSSGGFRGPGGRDGANGRQRNTCKLLRRRSLRKVASNSCVQTGQCRANCRNGQRLLRNIIAPTGGNRGIVGGFDYLRAARVCRASPSKQAVFQSSNNVA
jgi:hypothetical protein